MVTKENLKIKLIVLCLKKMHLMKENFIILQKSIVSIERTILFLEDKNKTSIILE